LRSIWVWRETFKNDASLRGKEEFDLLNSFYGADKRPLKERTAELLVMLKKD
jgi:hypothetical protein